MNVIVSQISPQAMESINWKYYIVFAGFSTYLSCPSPRWIAGVVHALMAAIL